jgi:lysophospholipase L1-like esterase
MVKRPLKFAVYFFCLLSLILVLFNIYYFFVRRDVGISFYIDKVFRQGQDVVLMSSEYQDLVDQYDHLNQALRGKKVIVFLGDSLTKGFNVQEYFPDRLVLNRGINSDTTVSILKRLDRNIANLKIKKLFLLIGFNDLQYRTNAEIVANVTLILDRIKANEIYVQSIMPVESGRNDINLRILDLNQRLMELSGDRGVAFIDLHRCFLDENGGLAKKYSLDGAHLNGAGYRLWKEVIEGKL